MLARRDEAQEIVDMNAVVREVALLVTSESIIRNVSIMLTFAPQPARVLGIRVDLQQAVLNVVTNAMEAVADRRLADRVVDVRVEVDEHRMRSVDPPRIVGNAELLRRTTGWAPRHSLDETLHDVWTDACARAAG